MSMLAWSIIYAYRSTQQQYRQQSVLSKYWDWHILLVAHSHRHLNLVVQQFSQQTDPSSTFFMHADLEAQLLQLQTPPLSCVRQSWELTK